MTPQTEREKVIILGSGPNRIGQGIEFDYSCVHAALELSRVGYETVMVNCNPETVSTDYDTADRLYFEPLTFEDVMEVYHAESQSGTVAGVIVQLGGQTPLGLAEKLRNAGVPVVGTTPEAINLAEDRGEFGEVLRTAGLPATDYDTADRLYFEPLTFEDVMEVYHAESQSGTVAGVIVQLGGQTPLGLAEKLRNAGVPVVGTTPEAINLAEDRGEFGEVLRTAGLPAPAFGTATSFEQARDVAEKIGYPVLVRPSYVLGGRGMEIVYDERSLRNYIERATEITSDHPVLVDRFLDNAIEIDVDALCDGTDVYLAGVMEHIEEAGIHSGDSACALPPMTLGTEDINKVRESTAALAHGIGVRGLINVQFALKDDILYVIEANPRASRTVPFVSKATGVPLAKAASRIMLGATIAELQEEGMIPTSHDGGSLPLDAPIAVKEAVLPFTRFRRPDGSMLDSLLSPEMKSTGEVMGLADNFGAAYAKAEAGAFGELPTSGTVFVSVANRDKRTLIFPIQRLASLGFTMLATAGTAGMLRRNGIPCETVLKHSDIKAGTDGVSIVDRIKNGEVDLILNTPAGSAGARHDGYDIRAAAVNVGIPLVTTVQGVTAAVQGIEALRAGELSVRALQELDYTED